MCSIVDWIINYIGNLNFSELEFGCYWAKYCNIHKPAQNSVRFRPNLLTSVLENDGYLHIFGYH